MTEALGALPSIVQGLQALEPMGVHVNAKKTIKDYFDKYNMTDVIKSADQELQAQAGDFIKKMSSMMSGQPNMQEMPQQPQVNVQSTMPM